jgi:serine/threonine protein phosphatase PrpC
LPHRLSLAGLSDIGRVRRRNEDSLSLIPDLGVAVVADGMGGHPGGDVASQIATDTAARLLAAAVEEAERDQDGSAFMQGLRGAMEDCILAAHADIRTRGRAEPELDGMGTTLTALALDSHSGCFVVGHVGDSRAYQFRGGALTQLTRDHTWIQEQIDRGDVLPQNAKRSPYAHLLTQCLGLESAPTPQLIDGRARPGDTFLLCTDGLVGMLDDGAMTRLLNRSLSTGAPMGNGQRDALQALLEAANEAGGQDNITAILAAIQ